MSKQALQGSVNTPQSVKRGHEQYLTFLLGGEEYGVDILRVQEIRGWDTVTSIPNTPDYILGVMNLRGAIVPIVDLRRRFQMAETPYTKTTVVIVLKVMRQSEAKTMGFVVDAVSEVYNISGEALKPPPDFGALVGTEFIQGLATVEEKTVILLDIDRLADVDMSGRSTTTH
jgi:purine-binding chemotaxis protein CheW